LFANGANNSAQDDWFLGGYEVDVLEWVKRLAFGMGCEVCVLEWRGRFAFGMGCEVGEVMRSFARWLSLLQSRDEKRVLNVSPRIASNGAMV
jgi:hypothetical protein